MFIRILQYWIILCSVLSFGGWLLSSLHALNGKGYLTLLACGVVPLVLFRSSTSWTPVSWRREIWELARRFRRGAPLLFLFILLLSTIGGILYDPMHGDSQSYRVPRIYHWLWENHWHWIHTGDSRMNVLSPGVEWFWAPGMLLLPGQRWLFFYNAISFLLLPGLIFSFFRQIGVGGKTAWWWMWLLPAAYGYALQAGGIATDSYSAIYSVAAVVFAMRGRSSRSLLDLWLSILSAALMTSAKQTNLLLIPLWFLPFLCSWRLLLRRPFLTVGVIIIAIGASALPTFYFNFKFTGTLQGFTGFDATRMEPKHPLWGIVGNIFALTAQNLLPPVFPLAGRWNSAMAHFLNTPLGSKFEGFEEFGHMYRAPSEATGGLGLALCLLLLWAALDRKRDPLRARGFFAGAPLWHKSFLWLPWLLLLPFMAKVGTGTNARYLSSMFPFLISIILVRSNPQHRSKSWRSAALGAIFLTLLLVVTSRQRPVFPVETFCSFGRTLGFREAFSKIEHAYTYYQEHAKLSGDITRALPRDGAVAGYAAEVGSFEGSLWRPFGSRAVFRITGNDSADLARTKGARYILLEEPVLKISGAGTMEKWFAPQSIQVIFIRPFRRNGPEAPPENIYLVKLN